MPDTNAGARLRSITFYLLLATIILAPLAFWPTQYFALESVKTLVIGVLTSVALILTLIVALKERELKLPPKSMVWIGTALVISLLVSAILSGNFIKSFFGQGFEIGAASFIIAALLGGYLAFNIVVRRRNSVVILYTGMVVAFLILWIFHVVRIFAGADFATLGILNSLTSTVLGSWFAFGMFASVIALVSISAVTLLSLSTRMKIAYWALFVISAATVFIVNHVQVWAALTLSLLGLTIYYFTQRPKLDGSKVGSFFSRIAWVPLIITILSLVMYIWGVQIAGPVVTKLQTSYAELTLPWQMTLDVAAGELKTNPLFGVGPNRFVQSYIANKPAVVNTTDAWSVEFTNGFGLIPSYLVTQGAIGGIIWVLFFVFFGILGVRSLRGFLRPGGTSDSISEGERPYARFVMVSSYVGSAFLWAISILYVPSHAVLFLAYVLTGIWLGSSVAYGRLTALTLVSRDGSSSKKFVPAFILVLTILVLALGFTHLKNGIALAYFGQGVESLRQSTPDPVAADKNFSNALALNPIDIYWQARAESTMSLATQKASQITSTSTASTSQALAQEATDLVNKAMEYAGNAVTADPSNYNNYISQARVSELGIAMRMDKAYENAVAAYVNAIQRNPQNPAIYLSLARLQATLNNLDQAIQTIGAALQVKNNYLDAVYLLSQVEAAKGNVQDAITAAEYATQLNPNNALLHFQLGLLEYSRANYSRALDAFTKAVGLEPVYANAKYFQGLSFARIGDVAQSITAFEELYKTNQGNPDIESILTTLRSGKSLFAAPQAVSAARPEQKSTPPIPEQ